MHVMLGIFFMPGMPKHMLLVMEGGYRQAVLEVGCLSAWPACPLFLFTCLPLSLSGRIRRVSTPHTTCPPTQPPTQSQVVPASPSLPSLLLMPLHEPRPPLACPSACPLPFLPACLSACLLRRAAARQRYHGETHRQAGRHATVRGHSGGRGRPGMDGSRGRDVLHHARHACLPSSN